MPLNTDPKFIRQRSVELAALFDTAPLKYNLGMELVYDDKGNAEFHLPYHEKNTHALKDVHGGIIATIIDNAGWFTAATRYTHWIATTDLTVKLIGLANREDLVATARLLHTGKKLAMTEMEVRTASGRLVAVGSGTFAVTSAATD